MARSAGEIAGASARAPAPAPAPAPARAPAPAPARAPAPAPARAPAPAPTPAPARAPSPPQLPRHRWRVSAPSTAPTASLGSHRRADRGRLRDHSRATRQAATASPKRLIQLLRSPARLPRCTRRSHSRSRHAQRTRRLHHGRSRTRVACQRDFDDLLLSDVRYTASGRLSCLGATIGVADLSAMDQCQQLHRNVPNLETVMRK